METAVEKIRQVLNKDEQIVWQGKPKPFWTQKGSWLLVAIGCLFVIVFPFAFPNLYRILFEKDWSLWMRLWEAAELLVYVGVTLALLLSPLILRIWSAHICYVVTNQHAFRKGPFFVKRWALRDLEQPYRRVRNADYSDVYAFQVCTTDELRGIFSKQVTNYHYDCSMTDGFINLPTAEALKAEAALKTLWKTRRRCAS